MSKLILYLTMLLSVALTAQTINSTSDSESLFRDNKFRQVVQILSGKELSAGLSEEEVKLLGLAYYNLYNYQNALKYLSESVNKSGYDFEVNYALGKSAIALGNDKLAETFFDEILAQDSFNFQALIESANIKLSYKNYKEAKKLYGKLLDQDSLNTYLLNKLAYCYLKMNQYEEAQKTYNGVLTINQFDQTAGLQLSKMYYDSEKYSEAKELLEKVLMGNNSNMSLNKLLGETFFKLTNYEAAVVYYTKSLALGDSSASLMQKLGFTYYFIAVSGAMINKEVYTLKINEALGALLKAYELEKENPLTTLYLGICYKELQEYGKAKFYLEETLNLIFPEYLSDVFTHLGAANEYLRIMPEAIEAYLTAYEYNNENKMLLFYIASAMDRYYADKQTPVLYYQKFIKEDKSGNQVLINYANERLEKLGEQIHFSNGRK